MKDPDNLELWLKVCAYNQVFFLISSAMWLVYVMSSSMQVDEELRQKGSTRDMIFKIPFLISHISSFMTLFEGDVILTGM